ncbi:MAG: DUF2207 domain-containing protein, partial [bacterium]
YYTYYNQNNALNIEWYYNVSNTTHKWIIDYKVHGGVGFYKDHDEIYWNLFTDYDVPVKKITAVVVPPEGNYGVSSLSYYLYETRARQTNTISALEDKTVHIEASDFLPKESLTFAVGWPKGIITKSAFWKDWFNLHWGDISAVIIIILTIVSLFIYWLFTEKIKQGRGTVVAEYDPPKDLRPAMAELIVTERITKRSWPATVVDLAVRGYLKIEEEKEGVFGKAINTLPKAIFFIIFLSFASIILSSMFFDRSYSSPSGDSSNSLFSYFFAFAFIIVIGKSLLNIMKGGLTQSDYTLTVTKDCLGDNDLEPYEKQFISNIAGLEVGSSFSTKLARKGAYPELYSKMQSLESELREETDSETKAYSVPISKQKIFNLIYIFPIIVVFFLFFFYSSLVDIFQSQLLSITLSVVWSLITVFVFVRYNPRLSKDGQILKEEWLGFKLYLETAERYRMQNLTPEIFEKYLPYAIVFSVEEKWSKAFESIVTTPPSWYGTSGVYAGANAGGIASSVGGFSPSAFSSSFATSFSSSFGSSGGGG